MKVYDLYHNNPKEIFGETEIKKLNHNHGTKDNYRLLPDDSVVFLNLFLEVMEGAIANNIDIIHKKLNQLPRLSTKFVFIDVSHDSIFASDDVVLELVNIVQKYYPASRCIFLSGSAHHYYSTNKNIIWYPYFFLPKYATSNNPRAKRVGCLNRRSAPHRVWLMHNLLSRQLIDHDRDIFSIAFADIWENKPCDLNAWLPVPTEIQLAIAEYPNRIATIGDNQLNNDHTTNHPAWSTALTVVTEAEVGHEAMISEKTMKAIASKCCWMAYTGQPQLDVMTDLGFNLNTFDQHAVGYNIEPIINMCQTLDTEAAALDYYHSKIDIINHNQQWLANDQWIPRYLDKFNSTLE